MPTKYRHTSIHRWLLYVVDPHTNFRYINTHKWKNNIHSMSVPWYSLCLHLCCVGNLIWTLLVDSICNECRHTGLLQIRFRWCHMHFAVWLLIRIHVKSWKWYSIQHVMIYSSLYTKFLHFLRTCANARTHISRNCKEKIWKFVPLNYTK